MKINPNCDPGHYYLLNNYNPGYFGNGTADTTHPFTIPPSPVRSIGDVLLEGQVSFRWYGEGWTQYVADPSSSSNVYCNICNPFQYQTSIMTDASVRDEVIRDTTQFYTDLQDGILPAVSFVKPGALNDGHPASSKWNLFEAFTRKILVELQKRPDLWATTAVLITTDEGGGYYDFRLRPAARLLRRRSPNPPHRRVSRTRPAGAWSQLQRPRLDPEVHRGELGFEDDFRPQPRQPAQPRAGRGGSLRSGQQPGDR